MMIEDKLLPEDSVESRYWPQRVRGIVGMNDVESRAKEHTEGEQQQHKRRVTILPKIGQLAAAADGWVLVERDARFYDFISLALGRPGTNDRHLKASTCK